MKKLCCYLLSGLFYMVCSCSSETVLPQERNDELPVSDTPDTPDIPDTPTDDVSGHLVPSNGKRMLFIGQDLRSVRDYVTDCEDCPVPTGITTYVNLSGVLEGNLGGLGWRPDGTATDQEIEWGAGPLNAYKTATEFPDSAVQIGLYIVGQTEGIARGDFDAHIRHLASYFNALRETAFYLRIGYEFDGSWNGYQATSYQRAYRKIVDVLRSEGVANVAYVWQSCTSPIDDLIDGERENVLAYYPGDDYVDWLGVSWFLRLDETAPMAAVTVSTQKWLLDELLALARAKGKPVMIAESSNQGYDNTALSNAHISGIWDGEAGKGLRPLAAQQVWDEWYVPYFRYIDENSDVIKAVSYINANWDIQDLWNAPYENGYWGDSRIEANTFLKTQWVRELQAAHWLHGGEGLMGFLKLD